MKVRRLATAVLCAAVLAAAWPAGGARADAGGFEPILYFVFGTMIVDAGATAANLIMLNSGMVKPEAGWIGVGAGVISYGIAVLALLEEDDVELGLPIVMGALGTAALATGIVVLRWEKRGAEESSRLSVAPCLVQGENGRPGPGIAMSLTF